MIVVVITVRNHFTKKAIAIFTYLLHFDVIIRTLKDIWEAFDSTYMDESCYVMRTWIIHVSIYHYPIRLAELCLS